MKILIITGDLAYPKIKELVKESKEDVLVHKADSQIAAFLTPNMIVSEIKANYNNILSEIDLILVPGLIRKSTDEITKALSIPTFKGSTDCADLPMVIDLIEDLELSTSKAADQLIEEEKRKQAFQFIEDFEKDTVKREELLKKPNNILVRNLPVGEDFPMRVLSEIANAPSLSKEELIKKAQDFIFSGTDMIDIGMAAGEDNSNMIPDLIKTLRGISEDIPLSIDTLNPHEIKVAIEEGIDLVLSLDLGNSRELVKLLKEHNVPAVLLPSNFAVNKVPHTISERLDYMDELINLCNNNVSGDNIDFIADLVLDPVNSSSIVDSIIACREFKNKHPYPLFFGIGNVTELMDTDSLGANVLLAGIGMELGASILFTPEESGKTLGSVYELAIASKMMFLAKNRNSIPKDLGINLVLFKDKKKRSDLTGDLIDPELNVPTTKANECEKFILDRGGSFKIKVNHAIPRKNSTISVTHFIKGEPQLTIEGTYPKEIYDELIKKRLITRMEHAAYLGSELQKAEIAIITGKEYVQDFELFKRPLDLKSNDI